MPHCECGCAARAAHRRRGRGRARHAERERRRTDRHGVPAAPRSVCERAARRCAARGVVGRDGTARRTRASARPGGIAWPAGAGGGMTLDLSQFRGIFFEECFESLDAMEATLLKLNPGTVAAEDINTIFRVAHSIKGGSATFGFAGITSFTHRLETLLDEMRAGRLQLTQRLLDLLLKSVDVIRGMLRTEQAEQPPDPNAGAELYAELEKAANEKQEPAAAAAPDVKQAAAS